MTQQNKNGKGRLVTFWQLLRENKIVIPKVQRDYAYGRDDDKAKDVRFGLLTTLHDSLQNNKNIILDFVYGSVTDKSELEPLDGQQRLTTLFLLHVYASIREQIKEEDDIKRLLKFTYSTRTSASEFCRNLVEGKYGKKDEDGTYSFDLTHKLSEQIKDSNEFLPNYIYDPTIASMLVVLDDIQEKFKDIEEDDSIWDKLTSNDQDLITFYYLPLDEFGLTDDLYIKMNSRGKFLTEYEIFKSKFEGYIDNKAAQETDQAKADHWNRLRADMTKKLDREWLDMMWVHSNNNVEITDRYFMNFFNAIFNILYYKQNEDYEIKKLYKYYEVIKTIEDLEFVINFIDAFSYIEKTEGFDDYWKNYFYYDDDKSIGKSDKIRLFKKNTKNIFTNAIEGNLTNADYILLYAISEGLKKKIVHDDLFQRYRILRNLIENSEYELRGKNMQKMLIGSETLIVKGDIIDGGFNKFQIEEERVKRELDESLIKYENHYILRGSLYLLLGLGKENIEPGEKQLNNWEDTEKLLRKFEEIFNEDYATNTHIIRKAFIKVGDFGQYTKRMEEDNKNGDGYKQRYYPNNWESWNEFFKYNNNLRNQQQIVKCLKECPGTIDEMKSDKINPYQPNDWKYYVVEYDDYKGNNFVAYEIDRDCWGVFNWDYKSKPLQVNILNSRSHNHNFDNNAYIEWNMLNRILDRGGRNRKMLQLDKHGSAPVVVKDKNISLNAVQEGWEVVPLGVETTIVDQLRKTGTIVENGDKYLLRVAENEDYIKAADELIEIINNAWI